MRPMGMPAFHNHQRRLWLISCTFHWPLVVGLSCSVQRLLMKHLGNPKWNRDLPDSYPFANWSGNVRLAHLASYSQSNEFPKVIESTWNTLPQQCFFIIFFKCTKYHVFNVRVVSAKVWRNDPTWEATSGQPGAMIHSTLIVLMNKQTFTRLCLVTIICYFRHVHNKRF